MHAHANTTNTHRDTLYTLGRIFSLIVTVLGLQLTVSPIVDVIECIPFIVPMLSDLVRQEWRRNSAITYASVCLSVHVPEYVCLPI